MKLYFSPTSPYARKARMTIIEKGLDDRVELEVANPFDVKNTDYASINPLNKVPALLRDDGSVVFDSPVICTYLDGLSADVLLTPADNTQWQVLTHVALTDGILDAAYNTVMERRRPLEQQSDMWPQRWSAAIFRSCDVIETEIDAFRGAISSAQIGLGAALGYLDFRLADLEWRESRPQLSGWFADFEKRPSMQQTVPPDGA